MDFKTYYRNLDPDAREKFAQRVGTTVGYCHQIAYGNKQIELGLADAIVAASKQDVGLSDLPLTDKALFQAKARKWDGTERRACKLKKNGPKGAKE
jgi:hypothetical protein